MLANYHTHTTRCHHAVGEDREYVEAAIKSGFEILGFSDHCPWIFENGFVSTTRMLPSDLDNYFYSLTSLKKEYKNDIKIYIGLESEYVPELMDGQNKLLNGYPLDYMILGQHTYGPEYSSKHYFNFECDEKSLKEYVDLVIEALKTGKYAYLAHPEIPKAASNSEFFNTEFTRLCEFLSKNNIPAEINMHGCINNRHYPSPEFCKIAAKNGVKSIIGCDAHTPEYLLNKDMHKAVESYARKYNCNLIKTLKGLE